MRTAAKGKIPPDELVAMVRRSGLTVSRFAIVMGLPQATLSQQLRGRCTIHGATLNAARFTLLRLGHSVKVEPIPAELLRPVRRKRR